MNRKFVEALCKIAGWTGTFVGRCSGRLPSLKVFTTHLVVSLVLTTAVTLAYIELGHDKGWMRADVWYTCIHTHHHFPWQ